MLFREQFVETDNGNNVWMRCQTSFKQLRWLRSESTLRLCGKNRCRMDVVGKVKGMVGKDYLGKQFVETVDGNNVWMRC